MRMRLAIAAATALAVSVALGACSKIEDGPGANLGNEASQTNGISTDPKDSQGPAAPVAGAKRGGTLLYVRNANFSHLDPARQYSASAMAVGQMYNRTLTSFKELGGNALLLVGDLATDPGKDVKKDCTVWEYTLKKGLKYEDGSPIVAADIAYGISRGFNEDAPGGPDYMQSWLADNPQWAKVWNWKTKGQIEYAPGITVVDDLTVRFTFKRPRCELPYALSLQASGPVPKKQDTGLDYDNRPFSSGPYKVTTFVKSGELILDRNEYWDPNSDPIRTAYPDKIHVKFGITAPIATNRMMADMGEDKNAAINAVDPGLVGQLARTEALKNRTINEQNPFVFYLYINNQRVKDLKVRQALNWAVDRDAFIKSMGGELMGTPASTILSPLTMGFKKYDAYPGGPNGNPDKARELLGGKPVELVMAHMDEPLAQQSAVAMKAGLERAGFSIKLVPVTADAYLDKAGERDNQYDLYTSGWVSDWATAATVIPVLLDGRTIKENSNSNYSYFNDEQVNSEIDRIGKITDPAKAAEAWAALDERIMRDFAPLVPIYYDRDYLIHGSNVGGLFESDALGTLSFVRAHIIDPTLK